MRETLRDRSGRTIGYIETSGNRQTLRNAHGATLGTFDGRTTRDSHGRTVGQGNLLLTLLK